MRPAKQKVRSITEYGDFQTPLRLAREVTGLLARLGFAPATTIEPTCGNGAFLLAAAQAFPTCGRIVGYDVNSRYVAAAQNATRDHADRVAVMSADFFTTDWANVVRLYEGPRLVLGNPPWVTNTELSTMQSQNLPQKTNIQSLPGIQAITGKSNFDISEWMLLRYVEWFRADGGTIAVLCKTAVARKIVLEMWKKGVPVAMARVYKIDAMEYFDASVDACLFIVQLTPTMMSQSLEVYDSFVSDLPSQVIGFANGHVVSNRSDYAKHQHLLGRDCHYTWRSGIKHDCSGVMELRVTQAGNINKSGEIVQIEDDLLYPLLKSSDIGNTRIVSRRRMLVTQTRVGEDTTSLRGAVPKTWGYLTKHAGEFNKRGSVIYRGKPDFSIFGVGPYTFAPWKVAISGFYKHLNFIVVGPIDGRPVVFDDTVNFVACQTKDEAEFVHGLLQSDIARTFLASMIHWDDKRPITIDLLKRLSIGNLATALGRESLYNRYVEERGTSPATPPVSEIKKQRRNRSRVAQVL